MYVQNVKNGVLTNYCECNRYLQWQGKKTKYNQKNFDLFKLRSHI